MKRSKRKVRSDMDNDDFQNGCYNCKYCSKLITEEPCMDCDPRYEGPKNHWEAEDDNIQNTN